MSLGVVVSGANRGIGLALTKAFLEDGATVWAGARDPKRANELNELVSLFKNKLKVLQLDVHSDASVKEFTDAIRQDRRQIDLLINNAGVLNQYDVSLDKVDCHLVSECLAVNAIGPLRLTKALLPLFAQSGDHPVRVANISSRVGSITDNTSGRAYAYRMSKSALNMFTKSLSIDFPDIIAVSLHPGWVQTEMGGANAPVTTNASAQGLFKVISGLKATDSGKFYDFQGKAVPW